VITQTVLNNREYLSSYVRDGSIGKERLDTKYALCLRACLNFHPVVHEQAYATGCVDLVLESGHRNAGDATRVFNEMKAPWAKSLGTISYGSKQDFPALQAADLIAYWLYKTENKRLDWTGVDKLELSPLAHELVRCGLSVVTHSITKSALIALRRNEPSQPAFRKVKIAAKADHFEGDWNDPNFIIFADLSVDRAEQRRLRSQDQSSRRKRRP
jgi:hypothetical protein